MGERGSHYSDVLVHTKSHSFAIASADSKITNRSSDLRQEQ